MALILDRSKQVESEEALKAEVSRVIRSSIDIRAKEELVLKFINYTDLSHLQDQEAILNAFYTYAKKEKEFAIQQFAGEEKLGEGYKLFIDRALKRGYAESGGTDLDEIIPPTSRRRGARELKKQQVLVKIQKLVEIYRGI